MSSNKKHRKQSLKDLLSVFSHLHDEADTPDQDSASQADEDTFFDSWQEPEIPDQQETSSDLKRIEDPAPSEAEQVPEPVPSEDPQPPLSAQTDDPHTHSDSKEDPAPLLSADDPKKPTSVSQEPEAPSPSAQADAPKSSPVPTTKKSLSNMSRSSKANFTNPASSETVSPWSGTKNDQNQVATAPPTPPALKSSLWDSLEVDLNPIPFKGDDIAPEDVVDYAYAQWDDRESLKASISQFLKGGDEREQQYQAREAAMAAERRALLEQKEEIALETETLNEIKKGNTRLMWQIQENMQIIGISPQIIKQAEEVGERRRNLKDTLALNKRIKEHDERERAFDIRKKELVKNKNLLQAVKELWAESGGTADDEAGIDIELFKSRLLQQAEEQANQYSQIRLAEIESRLGEVAPPLRALEYHYGYQAGLVRGDPKIYGDCRVYKDQPDHPQSKAALFGQMLASYTMSVHYPSMFSTLHAWYPLTAI